MIPPRLRRSSTACLGVLLIGAGCAGSGEGRRAASADGRSRGPTLGNDLLRAPRGITVGPPSLGVDLVDHQQPVASISRDVVRAVGEE